MPHQGVPGGQAGPSCGHHPVGSGGLARWPQQTCTHPESRVAGVVVASCNGGFPASEGRFLRVHQLFQLSAGEKGMLGQLCRSWFPPEEQSAGQSAHLKSPMSSVPMQASSGGGVEMCLVIPIGAGGLLGPWFLLLLLRLTRSFLTVEKYIPVQTAESRLLPPSSCPSSELTCVPREPRLQEVTDTESGIPGVNPRGPQTASPMPGVCSVLSARSGGPLRTRAIGSHGHPRQNTGQMPRITWGPGLAGGSEMRGTLSSARWQAPSWEGQAVTTP